VECDAVIVNVGYRLAPEHKAPAAIYDAYAAVKWVVAHAEELDISPSSICTFGESGGGWVTAACAVLLADKKESHLLQFHMPMLPMLNDMFW
jgi:acetyl esterase/lipase